PRLLLVPMSHSFSNLSAPLSRAASWPRTAPPEGRTGVAAHTPLSRYLWHRAGTHPTMRAFGDTDIRYTNIGKQ
ncbi:hypothetical protein JOQ06_017338, partial [Pogonophryne albipinna]